MEGARFIILNEINAVQNYSNKQELISKLGFTVVYQNPLHNNGYAIFIKLNNFQLANCLSNFGKEDERQFSSVDKEGTFVLLPKWNRLKQNLR